MLYFLACCVCVMKPPHTCCMCVHGILVKGGSYKLAQLSKFLKNSAPPSACCMCHVACFVGWGRVEMSVPNISGPGV